MKFNSENLKKLVSIYGPSGNENAIREYISKEIEDYVDEITVDAIGNLIARKKGSGKKGNDSRTYGSNWFNGKSYR